MQYLVEAGSRTHKILWPLRKGACFLGLAICLCLFCLCQLQKAQEVFLSDGVYFVDADCYARMTRVGIVSKNPGVLIQRHAFENYPLGIKPHTSAPMDYLIAGANWLFGSRDHLDFIGAWVSPLLGVTLLILAWIWGQRTKLPYRWSMMVLLSVSPILLHGFAVGRPDHQSLILLLTGSGLLAEASLWKDRSSWISIWWGISWGMALWVSWFEPFMLLSLGLAVRILVLRSECLHRTWWLSLGVAGLLGVFAIALEGFPGTGLRSELRPYFFRWATSIGELQALNPLHAALAWTGWLSLPLPFALAWVAWKRKERVGWLWLALVIATAGLTAWYSRWGYFLALSVALALPTGLGIVRRRWIGYGLFLASLWPVVSNLDAILFPDGENRRTIAENLQENQYLRQAAFALASLEGDGILAPWWLTPQLVYWSGKSGVAGSSHESLSGAIDTARFFVTQNENEAKSILRDRHSDFIVVCDANRLLENSYQTLGETGTPANQMAAILFRTPSRAPHYLRLVFQNPSFKVYRVQRNEL